jgi:hypothetical protein
MMNIIMSINLGLVHCVVACRYLTVGLSSRCPHSSTYRIFGSWPRVHGKMASSATERAHHGSSPSIMDTLQEDPASFLEWDERQVAAWMDVIGYGQYQDLIMGGFCLVISRYGGSELTLHSLQIKESQVIPCPTSIHLPSPTLASPPSAIAWQSSKPYISSRWT